MSVLVDPEGQHRRSLRLQGYDYTQAGAYFVTIVTQDRACLFGDVVDGHMRLNDAGRMVAAEWDALCARFMHIDRDAFVVMPNHIHGVVVIAGTTGTDGSTVGAALVGAHTDGAPVFDSIIVVTDRRLLDQQIKDTIKEFAQVGATVGHAEHSGDLRRFIAPGKKIIISTVQKFPFILDEIGSEHRGRSFAIDMDSYRVEKQAAAKIQLPDTDAEIEPVPAAGGGRKPEPKLDRLSNILKTFNDQFGNIPWTDADRVHKLITEDIPNRVAADTAYQNAKKNSDKQNARIEHDKALARVMTAVLKDDTELFKQFMDNESFRRWMTDTDFGLTYESSGEDPRASMRRSDRDLR